nr:hypothetical protein CoNPh38_CDS0295 [Staphylococcus phage S-CoN_Ph38]
MSGCLGLCWWSVWVGRSGFLLLGISVILHPVILNS